MPISRWKVRPVVRERAGSSRHAGMARRGADTGRAEPLCRMLDTPRFTLIRAPLVPAATPDQTAPHMGAAALVRSVCEEKGAVAFEVTAFASTG